MFTISITLLVAHTLGDFFLQSNWMAINKSKDNRALFLHVLIYSLCFIPWGFTFYLVTFVTHFLTDYVTSRITSRLWFIPLEPMNMDEPESLMGPKWSTHYAAIDDKKRHWFFTMIGVDQLIHFVTLVLTYKILIG